MRERISISAVRARLSRVLKQLEDDPDRVYEITVSGRVVGELRAPDRDRFRVTPGAALLNALATIGEPETDVPAGSATAREHDRFLCTQDRRDRPRSLA